MKLTALEGASLYVDGACVGTIAEFNYRDQEESARRPPLGSYTCEIKYTLSRMMWGRLIRIGGEAVPIVLREGRVVRCMICLQGRDYSSVRKAFRAENSRWRRHVCPRGVLGKP